jgi:hypothetical protein
MILPGAEQLEPFIQGSMSRLCGLYSVLNAVQLSLYPRRLMPPQRKRLFLAAVSHLGHAGLLSEVLGAGMEEEDWRGLGEAVSRYVEDRLATRCRLRRLEMGKTWVSRRGAFSAIAAAVERRRPVLIYVGGVLNHYTVIVGQTEGRLLLFDSLGLKWIAEDSLGLGYASRRRNWIVPQNTFALVTTP